MSNLSQHIRSLAKSSTTPQTLLDIAEDVQELEAENRRLREALSAVLDDLQLRADIRNGERVLDLSHGVLMKAEKALNPTSAGGLYDD